MKPNTFCTDRTSEVYSNLEDAAKVCSLDDRCHWIVDSICGGFHFQICSPAGSLDTTSGGSCVHVKGNY